jgi:hypothetical protein
MKKLTEEQCRFVEWAYSSEWHFDERIAKWKNFDAKPLTTQELFEFYINNEC